MEYLYTIQCCGVDINIYVGVEAQCPVCHTTFLAPAPAPVAVPLFTYCCLVLFQTRQTRLALAQMAHYLLGQTGGRA